MSFYGEQPKLSELNFKFDAYYPSRAKLVEVMSNGGIDTDVVPIGAYILISYYIDKDIIDMTGITLQGAPGRYTQNINAAGGTLTYNVTQSDNFSYNLNLDLSTYGNSYHNTVWQRVTSDNNNTFIMIAELNSLAPQLDINYIDSAEIANSGDRYVYTINQSDSGYASAEDQRLQLNELMQYLSRNNTDPYSILTRDSEQAPKAEILKYHSAKLDLENSSELGYKITVPRIPYFIFNLRNENYDTATNTKIKDDSINIAYDPRSDAYVLNMFLGNFQEYLSKSVGTIIDSTEFSTRWENANNTNT